MAATIDPRRIDAVVFDLDGVVTDTARVHAAAWTRLFDELLVSLAERGDDNGADLRPFSDEDYRRYVDGKARSDGVRAFLASRGISSPLGGHDGPGESDGAAEADGQGGEQAVQRLGEQKNRYFLDLLATDGVAVFSSTVDLVRALARSGVATGVISASRNCRQVLEAAGLGDLFQVRVDGVVAADLGLAGKPEPDVFVEAARRLDAEPDRAVVVEDALAGVEAGNRGGFAMVIGVDRTGHPDDLLSHGADVVVSDLAEVSVSGVGRGAPR